MSLSPSIAGKNDPATNPQSNAGCRQAAPFSKVARNLPDFFSRERGKGLSGLLPLGDAERPDDQERADRQKP
ncbi:MAG: hypothetical protein ABIN58_00575, partial [candidate division WOR-3 bacterium]